MFGELIPIIDAIKANKKLKNRNNAQEIEIPEKLNEIDIKYIEEDYKNTLDTKNRFEDKAKTIIAALTIAVTLILNLSKVLDTVSEKFGNSIVDVVIFILATLAIIYMLMAGIMSIQVLIKENIFYPISLKDRTVQDKKSIYTKTQLNVNQNLIRNNIIYSAYCSIRNSVFCLVIVFILAIIPFQMSDEKELLYENNGYENISFEANAVQWLIENKEKEISFERIISKYAEVSDGDDVINVYDVENDIIVTIRMENTLYVIENIMSNIEEIK